MAKRKQQDTEWVPPQRRAEQALRDVENHLRQVLPRGRADALARQIRAYGQEMYSYGYDEGMLNALDGAHG